MPDNTSRWVQVGQGPIALALLAIGLIVTMVPFTAGGSAPADERSEGFYDDWPLDDDGNQIHDRLDERLAEDATGRVLVELHYEHHPTDEDVEQARQKGRIYDLYRYANWDDLLVRTDYASLADLAELDGVVGVELMPKASLSLETSVPAVRARSAEVVDDGFDHNNSVHDTLGLRGEGTVIAVLDTGVDNTHESLDDLDDDPSTSDPKLVTKTGPFGEPIPAGVEISSNLEAVGCVDPADTFTHGTHVASIAAGTGGGGNDTGGMAPQAQLVDVGISGVSFRLAGDEFSGTPIGLDWILSYQKGDTCFGDPGEDRIDVVQMSLSLNSTDPDASINRKVTELARAGMTFVAAAGNSGPSPETLESGPEGAIMVGSSYDNGTIGRSDDVLSDFSSRGPRDSDRDADRLDELRPDLAAPGDGIFAALAGSRTATIGQSGTSMAAPHVSGAAALVLQANPDLRPVDRGRDDAMGGPGAVPVRDLLIETAQPKTDAQEALPQLNDTGRFGLTWNNGWGYGLLDAYEAVRQAPGFVPATEPLLRAGAASEGLALAGEPTTLIGQAAGGDVGYTYEWTLPDGSTATGRQIETTFEDAGSKTVSVTVTDADGDEASADATIPVYQPPLELGTSLHDAYDRTEDGVWLVDPANNTDEVLNGTLSLRDADGRAFDKVPATLDLRYKGLAPVPQFVVSNQGSVTTGPAGEAAFTIRQDVPGYAFDSEPYLVSLTGYHEVTFELGGPLDREITMDYWVGPGRPPSSTG